jgi:3-hydroxyisobutyrate dehydrogenase
MAAHLARRQHELTVWNRTGSRAEAFVRDSGGRLAATPRAAVQGVEVVVTCLPTSAEVLALLDGEQGVLAGLSTGTLWLDCTSGDPDGARQIAARLAAAGVAYADCPVSGGTNGADAATLTVMVGADPETFARARPILAAFAKRIEHLGPVGAGSALKAVNNALLAVNILAFGEGFGALVKAGVPAKKALDVLNASSGHSFVTESLVPERVMNGKWPKTFRLALLEKDVGIAVALLKAQGVEPGVISQAWAQLRDARTALGEDADYLEAIRLQEQRLGVEIRG